MPKVKAKVFEEGSFNRYMVECESETWLHNSAGIRVLIDTWWNVNNKSQKFWKESGFGFNRYMVECEFNLNWICKARF